MAEGTGNQPLFKVEMTGLLAATAWENENEKDGKTFTSQTVQLSRRYKDNEGNWKSTNVLRINDIPKAILALQEAYKRLVTYKPATQTEEATE